jgi:hypothetical protein
MGSSGGLRDVVTDYRYKVKRLHCYIFVHPVGTVSAILKLRPTNNLTLASNTYGLSGHKLLLGSLVLCR